VEIKTEDMMKNFEVLINEANDHFNSGRFRDAARTFEYLVQFCLKIEYYEDIIYYLYKTILSWSYVGDIEQIIKQYQKLGILALKISTQIGSNVYEITTDDTRKVEILRLISENLYYLGEIKKKKELSPNLIDLYLNLSIKSEIKLDIRISYLEKASVIADENNNKSKSAEIQNNLASLLEEKADLSEQTMGIGNLEIASHFYKEASKIYKRLGNTKKSNILMEKSKLILSNSV